MDENNYSISAFAKKLGVSYQAIVKVRDGGELGSKNNLKAAKLLNLDPEWLASGKGQKHPQPAGAHFVGEELSHYTVQSPMPVDQLIDQLCTVMLKIGPDARQMASGLLERLAINPGNISIKTTLITGINAAVDRATRARPDSLDGADSPISHPSARAAA